MFYFKTITAASTFAFALSACEDVGGASKDRRVAIFNETGQTIQRFYGSRVSTDSWEEDILGKEVLPNGERWLINFDDGTGACLFDMKAELRDGTNIVKPKIDVCREAAVTFGR